MLFSVVNLMENLEFGNEPIDSNAAIEEIDRSWKRRFVMAIPLFFSLPLSGLFLLIFQHQFPDAVFLFIFALGIFATCVGMGFLATSSTVKSYVRTLRTLLRLSPPEPRVVADYAVMLFDKVYVFVWRKAPFALYFVAFEHSETTTDAKIDVPKTFWKWDSALHIEGFRVHNRKGTFTIPTPDGDFVTGEGYVLVLPTRPGSYMIHYPDMSREHLLGVVEYASNLASGISVEHIDI